MVTGDVPHELIGYLLQALPHPSLDYDRGCWSWIRKSGTAATILVSRNGGGTTVSPRQRHRAVRYAGTRTRPEATERLPDTDAEPVPKSLLLLLSPNSMV